MYMYVPTYPSPTKSYRPPLLSLSRPTASGLRRSQGPLLLPTPCSGFGTHAARAAAAKRRSLGPVSGIGGGASCLLAMGLITGSFKFLMGMGCGVYVAQNYNVPNVKKLFNTYVFLAKHLEETYRKPKKDDDGHTP
ncbi:hypothetical protein QYE76_059359 [Lolium multiflorum]|uniref:Uncharacterized protein n=1 Tax=Lolium multiflorum TaxID=4521 RepID=A0AAD8W592_LOLMU|nr:hypothetical protein QYE76_059359 [Lolium multiflorum]